MGSSESRVVIEYYANSYDDQEILEAVSSPNFKDVLRLYRITPPKRSNEHFLEESLFIPPPYDEVAESFQVVLINQFEPTRCFSIHRSDSIEEGKKKLRSFSVALIPFIDELESVHTPHLLGSLLKLRKTYPNWSLHKIAEYLQLPEVEDLSSTFKPCYSRQDSLILEQSLEIINKEKPSFKSDTFGSTPLNFFIEKHPDIVASLASTLQSLVKTGKDIKGSVDNITKYVESPIHAAIRLSQDSVLKVLLEKGANPLIPCGHAYPIHLAMKHESLGCLRLLLKHDVQCVTVKDKKYAGSMLHWAKNTDQIDHVMEIFKEFDLNIRNSENECPIHIMVKRKRLSPTISLVCHGAEVNVHGNNGLTPLHYAVQMKEFDMVQALLVMGANFNMEDDNGNRPIDYLTDDDDASSQIRCLFKLFSHDQFDYDQTYRNCNKSIYHEKTGKEALLALDGGGMRGLVLSEVLIALENLTKQPLRNLFDWISGTSTGSYLAASLALGRPVRHCQRAYFRLGRTCFVGIRPYPTENMDFFLANEFGGETTVNEIEFPKVVIPAVLVDRRPAMLHLFRNYEAPYDNCFKMRDARFPRPPLPSDQLLWLAIRSSCSAPSYFRSTGRYLDGGLIANNPTLDLISEAHKYNTYNHKEGEEKKKMGVVVSVGTGRPPLEQLRPIDLYLPSSVWDTAEIVDNLKSFVDLMVDQVSASDDHVTDRARSWCEMADISYHRFNPTLSSDVQLNEIDDQTLLNMLCDVRKYIKQNLHDLEYLAKLLLGEEPSKKACSRFE